jgi:Arc/MetJ-type ribon-helix-helix transcriptional regulator
MREASKQRSIRLPGRVDAMLADLVQEGAFRNCTEAIIEGILRLYEDLTVCESEVTLRLRLTKGEYNNLKRLKQLDGGSEELWAERLVGMYAFQHANLLAEQAAGWKAIFEAKRELEERTESLTELRRR